MRKFLFILAMLVLPTALFAEQGAVVGYFQTVSGMPTTNHLDRSSHIILFHIYPNADGSGLVLDWWKPNNLASFINTAHSKNVKVIVALGGSGGATYNFINATNNTNRAKFVQVLKNFVETNNLDGLDLDWETQVDWRQWADLVIDLKAAMPNKRISGTLGADSPYCQVGNHFTTDASIRNYFQQNIWKIDAVQIMTYDMWGTDWTSSASAADSKKCIDNWAAFGAGQSQFSKEKIFIGCHDQQDNESSVRQKIRDARQGGYGGAILWQLTSGNATTFLNWAWDENTKNGGYIGGGVNPPTPAKRHNVPGSIHACEATISIGQCEGTNVGYLVDGSSIEYLLKVDGAGSYKIQLEASEGDNFERQITIYNGGSNLGTISVSAGSDWQAYSPKEATVNLPNGDMTLRLSVNGAVNIRNINITKASGSGGEEPPIPPVGDAPDLADGSWGDDAWSGVWDEGKNGSTLGAIKQGNPITASWKLGDEPDWDVAGDDDAPYVGIAFFDGDWSGVTQIEIKYSVNQPTYIALSSTNGHEYYVLLETGNNKTKTITPNEFGKFEWDGGSHSLKLSEVEGLSLSAFDSYGFSTDLTVTSLKVKGLVIEAEGEAPVKKPIGQNKTKTVSGVKLAVTNGNINLWLPTKASNANIVLLDIRGRILFERNVAVNANFASVALPKSILRHQAAILQVKTNSGFNMTKRILIK